MSKSRSIAGLPLTFLIFLVFNAGSSAATPIPEATITPISTPAGSFPTFMAAGAGGEIYVADDNLPRLIRVSSDGTVVELPIPGTASETLIPSGIALGPDGNLWFVLLRQIAGGGRETLIGRMTLSGTEFTSFSLPSGAANSATSAAREFITVGPDGNLWFTESNASKIGRVTPSGAVTEFPVRNGSFPNDIVSGPDGNLWITLESAMRVARVSTSGEVTEFEVQAPGSPTARPNRITQGPDEALYFTDNAVNSIWRVTTSGVVTPFPIPAAGSNPNGICFAPDGHSVYFTERGLNKIGRLDLETGTFEDASLPLAGFPHEISLAFTSPSSTSYSFVINSPNLFRMNVPAAPDPVGPVLELQSSLVDPTGGDSAEFHPAPGSIFEYSIVVSNFGNRDSSRNAVVSLPLPDAIELVSSAGCSQSASTLLCPAGYPIAAGAAREFRVFVRLRPDPPPELSMTPYLFGGGDPTNPKRGDTVQFATAAPAPIACHADASTLCIGGSRFSVRVFWNALRLGTSGKGFAVPLTSDTGTFWFFGPNAVELVVKVVDGRAVNGRFWIFYGALTNVEYILQVVDSVTGQIHGYYNPQDHQASFADTSAFGTAASIIQSDGEFDFIPMNFSGISASSAPSTSASSPGAIVSPCVADATTLCLKGNRFKVKVAWQALHLGTSGNGNAVPLPSSAGTDTGYFWFFGPTAVELLCKVVDGTALNGRFWFFYGALSNVQYTITVTDTQTGDIRTYTNPQDTLGSVGDTSAFTP